MQDRGRGIDRAAFAGYAAGSVGTGGFGVLPGLVLAYYLTDTLAVPAVAASVVVLVPKIIDVLINPLVGARSDLAASRTGTRGRFMLSGALAIAPLFVLTFCTPTSWSAAPAAGWVLIFFSLTAVAYSFFQVPYVALPAELTDDYHERTRLVTARIAVLAGAILLVGAGGPAIRDVVGGAAGYVAMAVAAAVVISGGMLATTFLAAPRAVVTPPSETGGESTSAGYRAAFHAFSANRHFRILLLVFVIQALASAVMLAGAQYVATYTLDDRAALTLLFVALVAPAIMVMPLWYRLGRRFGKITGLVASSVLFILGSGSLVIAVWAPGWWLLAGVALAGVGYAGMQAFPLALLPDVIDEHSQTVGRDRGGAMSGLWTAGETVGLALGPAVFLIVLAATGFVSSTGDETPIQPDSALAGIVVGFSVLPALLVVGALALLRRYQLSEPGGHR